MMLIPNQPFDNNSKAEHSVFRLLKEVYNTKDVLCYAFPSVILKNHPKKRFSEIDFLLVNPYGVFVLEVKGGRVSCHDGIWQFKSASGHIDTRAESPFYQANTALQGLREALMTYFGKEFVSSICFGYGVIMPDSVLDMQSLEWDACMLCNRKKIQSFKRWLYQFFLYWTRRNAEKLPIRRLSVENIEAIKQYIRPAIDEEVVGF